MPIIVMVNYRAVHSAFIRQRSFVRSRSMVHPIGYRTIWYVTIFFLENRHDVLSHSIQLV